jgi:hypothetical protein
MGPIVGDEASAIPRQLTLPTERCRAGVRQLQTVLNLETLPSQGLGERVHQLVLQIGDLPERSRQHGAVPANRRELRLSERPSLTVRHAPGTAERTSG